MRKNQETLKNKMENAAIAARLSLLRKEKDWKEYLKDNTGAAYLDEIIKVIIYVVIGALILGALYWLFKDTLIPQIQSKIMEMFNPPARP